MNPKIYLFLISIAFIPFLGQQAEAADGVIKKPLEQVDLDRLDKEITSIVRQNNLETSKRLCVDYWTKPNQLEALSKFATISEQCSCVQEEMKYLVSDDLATRLIETQLQGRNSLDITQPKDDVAKNTVSEWGNYLNSSYRTCSEKFLNRRK